MVEADSHLKLLPTSILDIDRNCNVLPLSLEDLLN